MSADADARRIAANIGKVRASAVKDVDAVVKKGAQNIKQGLEEGIRVSEHFRGMAGSISYEAQNGLGRVSYEVGPDKNRRGGALGNVFYFGTSRGGGTGDLDGPVEAEAPNLEKHLADLAGDFGRRI